eukprot:659676-Hanusia_phi.AAC.7
MALTAERSRVVCRLSEGNDISTEKDVQTNPIIRDERLLGTTPPRPRCRFIPEHFSREKWERTDRKAAAQHTCLS